MVCGYLQEALAEMFSVNRLGLSPSLVPCRVSTDVIESPHSGGVLPVAREEDRAPLGCRPAHDREQFSQDRGIPGSVDAEGGFGSARNAS